MTICHGLKLEAADGKKYRTDCANTEGIFRIIQSIPSPKSEPFKRRLAKVAGNARKNTEKELGRSVISNENYLSGQLSDNEQGKLEDK